MTDVSNVPMTGAVASELVPTTPAGMPSTPAEAAARLRQIEADPKWREGFLNGSPQHREEFEALTTLAAAGDQDDLSVETVDGVSDPQALSRAAYNGLIDGLRAGGLPASAEQYMRDLDAGRRIDRPTAGDGLACRQARARLIQDAEWRQRLLNGDVKANNLRNVLDRIIAYAADDSKPVMPGVHEWLTELGLR
jgi:hypothetical protein